MVKGGLLKRVNSVNPLKTLTLLLLVLTVLLLFSIVIKSREYFGSATAAEPGTTVVLNSTRPKTERKLEIFLFLDYKRLNPPQGKFIDKDWPELVIKYSKYPNIKIDKKPGSELYDYLKTDSRLSVIFKDLIADPVKWPANRWLCPILILAYTEYVDNKLAFRQITKFYASAHSGSGNDGKLEDSVTFEAVELEIKFALSAFKV